MYLAIAGAPQDIWKKVFVQINKLIDWFVEWFCHSFNHQFIDCLMCFFCARICRQRSCPRCLVCTTMWTSRSSYRKHVFCVTTSCWLRVGPREAEAASQTMCSIKLLTIFSWRYFTRILTSSQVHFSWIWSKGMCQSFCSQISIWMAGKYSAPECFCDDLTGVCYICEGVECLTAVNLSCML